MDKFLLLKIFYAAAAIQGVLLAFLLWRARNNQPANKILAFLLLLISFHLILVGFDEREFFMKFPHLSRISWVIGTLYGPLVFLFMQQIIRLKVKAYWTPLLFVPFLLTFVSLIPYFLESAAEKRTYLDAFETARADDFGWINQFVSIVHIFFVVGNLIFYLRWERRQSEEFSSMEAVRIKWLRKFLVFLLVITGVGVLIFFSRIWNIVFLSDLYRFHFFGIVLLFYWLSYKALTQPVLFGMTYSQPEPVVPASIEKRTQSGTENEAVFQKVRSVLEKDRLYLKSDLTLTELALKAGYTRNQVSHAINSSFDGNFFDFINDFRVEEFKRQALSPDKQHLTQLGIAMESGFNSKASFYSVFKKKTGMTPAAFVEKQSRLIS